MSGNKVQFQFAIPKELDVEFRVYVAQKYGGYHKGDLSKEVEDLIRYRLEKQETVRQN